MINNDSSNQSLPKELEKKLLRTVPFLKRWAANPESTGYAIARPMGIPDGTQYEYIIPEFLNIFSAALPQPEFPSNLLLYYNQHGNPDPELNLTEVEAHAIKLAFERERALAEAGTVNTAILQIITDICSRRTGSSQRFLTLAQMQNSPRISMSDFFPGIRAVLYDADVFSKIV